MYIYIPRYTYIYMYVYIFACTRTNISIYIYICTGGVAEVIEDYGYTAPNTTIICIVACAAVARVSFTCVI